MSRPLDLHRELAAVIDEPSRIGGFLERFAASWATKLLPGDGYGEAELVAAESRIGIPLPGALREAYRLLGRRKDLTANQDPLVPLDELDLNDDGALVFRTENQAAVRWGIRAADLRDADPAASIRPNLADRSAESWEPWLAPLSLAVVELVMSETVHFEDDNWDFLCDVDDEGLTQLEARWTRLPIPDYPTGDRAPGIRWFASPDLLICDEARTGLAVRGRTEAALDEIRDLIPGGWLNDPR
ncbi:SMI1/KNR4 family protein [Yinghuangia seranimata]|uniref:SMI1/KNR4 family protein n=1 Tax=Yinghuangia seranimata TaxID=408067 RepID=UPI00248D1F02|nr:SMI1/KNR4 family protein [Yinghuangia seranimata]MDI2128514.1 SMI1/KNR4 family protein [Yinghuangia seranimata]